MDLTLLSNPGHCRLNLGTRSPETFRKVLSGFCYLRHCYYMYYYHIIILSYIERKTRVTIAETSEEPAQHRECDEGRRHGPLRQKTAAQRKAETAL